MAPLPRHDIGRLADLSPNHLRRSPPAVTTGYRRTMTERKPPGVGFETWVERQLREAAERGAFDDLPGAGKPIPDLDKPHDELWWVKQKLRDEGLAWLPPTSPCARRPRRRWRR